MKISNILFILLGAFIVSALAYDKVILIKESKKIDRTIQFGDHNNVIPVNFNNVVVNGGNFGGRLELHQRKKSEIRYKDHVQSIFTHKLKNDTLYINFKPELTKSYYKDWTKNKVVVLYDSIQSFSFNKSQNYIYCKRLSKLKIIGKGTNSSRIHLEYVDSLEIETYDYTKVWSEPSKANYLKVKAHDKSNIELRILTASEDDIEMLGESMVKIN